MNRILLSLVFVAFCFSASAQKVYFMYLQSESDQPFYVKMNNKVHSSSASGYLILSRLRDSTYHFSIGFPGNKWPEQNFSVAINKKDHGFLLKNFNEKGWGLFNLQSLEVQMAVAGSAKTGTSVSTENKEVSLFTDILSKAADDPSLKEKPVIVIAEKKIVAPVAEVVTASAPLTTKEAVKEKPPEVVAAKSSDVPAVEIVKKEEPKVEGPAALITKKEPDIAVVSKEGEVVQVKEPVKEKPATAPVVIDDKKPNISSAEIVKKEEPKQDGSNPLTIKEDVKEPVKEIVITVKNPEPVKTIPKEALKEPAKEAVVEEKAAETLFNITVKEETEIYQRSVVKKRSESSTTEGFGLVFIDETGEGSTDTIRLMIPHPKPVVAPQKSEEKEEKKFLDIPAAGNAPAAIAPEVKDSKIACPVVAVEADFFQVRKLMAAEEKDDDMIAAAQKHFQAKCFTTQQIRNLGALFLNDGARYKFFDMAYPYTSDKTNFISLESELKDPNYLSQFRAIVKQ